MAPIGPPLAGSSLTFAYSVCKDLFVYIKHKRKRVKDLVKDFEELRQEVYCLNARWDDINAEVQRRSWFTERNEEYTAVENKLLKFRSDFEKIEKEYTMYSEYLGIQNQEPQAAEASNEANVDQAITNTPAGKFAAPSKVKQQKIWTRKFFKLAQLDKDIVKLTPKMISFKHELRFENMTRYMKPQRVARMRADEVKNIVPSHEKHLADLKEYLCRENCKRIGIYGAPGVGKTNIMKNLNNCFDPSTPSDCNLELDYVIWVAVPRKPTKEEMIENVQKEIIQRLKIDWQMNNSLNAADIIDKTLSQKKYLLLLDDFSPLINLEKIGIDEKHKHGKVVITAKESRDLWKVGFDEFMIEVNDLSLEDSWKLFCKFVEINTLSEVQRDMIGPILKQVGRLPEPITLTAKFLNKHRERTDVWKAIKQRLQSDVSISDLLPLGGLEHAYKLFYENLASISLKKCLLYAALFPNEHKIPKGTLVECWKAEQFLSSRLPTNMEAAQTDGALIFNQLEMSGLLQSCGSDYVKMQGYFRKIALGLPFPEDGDGKSIVSLGPEINERHLEEEEWNVARRVSLIGTKLKKLPSSPQWHCLSTLFLQLNPNLTSIPDLFFQSMKALLVLDLHRTGIKSLPPSVSNLRALRCLYLNHCSELRELPPKIVELEELEVLDIQGTSIHRLPEEISSLISLRCLRISFVEPCNPTPESRRRVLLNWFAASPKRRTGVIFPPRIADKLHQLEELTIALGGTGISEEIRNRILGEVSETTKVVFIDPCIQRPFQSLDQENFIQSAEGTDLPNPSLPENPRLDLRTEIQSPRSNNEGPSYPQSGSIHGRTYSNYQASKKGKEKIVENPKSKKTAIGGVLKIRGSPETNACQINSQGDDFPSQQTERASGGDVDRPCSSTGASTSGTAGRAD